MVEVMLGIGEALGGAEVVGSVGSAVADSGVLELFRGVVSSGVGAVVPVEDGVEASCDSTGVGETGSAAPAWQAVKMKINMNPIPDRTGWFNKDIFLRD